MVRILTQAIAHQKALAEDLKVLDNTQANEMRIQALARAEALEAVLAYQRGTKYLMNMLANNTRLDGEGG